MSHSAQLILWVGVGLVALVVVIQVAKYPSQVFWKLMKSAVVGCLFIFAIDWIGQYFHFHMPFNPLTALTAGLLGIPGVIALVTLQLWLF
jgi:inhibitor of the pro-sigma K processing machinery